MSLGPVREEEAYVEMVIDKTEEWVNRFYGVYEHNRAIFPGHHVGAACQDQIARCIDGLEVCGRGGMCGPR